MTFRQGNRLRERTPTSLQSRCMRHMERLRELSSDRHTTSLAPTFANVNLQPVCHTWLSRDAARDKNETHCCKLWCCRKHVFALACTSDWVDHQSTSPDPLSLVSSARYCSRFSSSYFLVHLKFQHAFYICPSSRFHLCLIQFQPSAYVKHRAASLAKRSPVNLSHVTLRRSQNEDDHTLSFSNGPLLPT